MDDGKPKLLAQVREQIRLRNYSIRTEAVYAEWVVIPPFLALARNRGQAARANFCLGVMPPRAIFGLS